MPSAMYAAGQLSFRKVPPAQTTCDRLSHRDQESWLFTDTLSHGADTFPDETA